MQNDRLENMVKGWFVGKFSPTIHATDACEVAVKYYRAGDKEDLHHHKIATEITLILSGQVCMNGRDWTDGDIIKLEPSEATNFHAITDAITVVVKTPCVPGDKYILES